MALPVIATNWSGPTEYMTDSNSYPLRTHGLVEITQGAFACAPAALRDVKVANRTSRVWHAATEKGP
jgi:hypothetical protein